jgi:hypothetical protein
MNTVLAINEWVVPGSDQKAQVRNYRYKGSREKAGKSLWQISTAASRANRGESIFYGFFLVLAAASSISAFSTLLETLNSGSLAYFVQHALR